MILQNDDHHNILLLIYDENFDHELTLQNLNEVENEIMQIPDEISELKSPDLKQ